MSKLKIEDFSIELPSELDVDERIELCKEIIQKYEKYFTYELPNHRNNGFSADASEKVKYRLMVLGNYIYSASTEGHDKYVVTEWKRRRNQSREVFFSEIER